MVPWNLPKHSFAPNTQVSHQKEDENAVVYQRYYHVFIDGELQALVESIGGCTVIESGFDADNWWIRLQKL